MKKETEDFLKQLGDEREAEIARQQAEPAIKEKALTEFKSMATLLQATIADFNSNPQSKRSGISLQLEGPVQRGGDSSYLIRELIDGAQFRYPKGQVLRIDIPFAQNFDGMRFGFQFWQNNLSIDAIASGSGGYTPGEEPKKVVAESYVPVIKDTRWGWALDKRDVSNAQSSQGLLLAQIHKLIMNNIRA